MNKQVDESFDRVDKGLAAAFDSISKLHPSAEKVRELVKADEELGKTLKQVERHQRNVQRLEQVRATAAAYDKTIKDQLQLLADAYRDLKAAGIDQSSSKIGPLPPIPYADLLAYASRISKTTMPSPSVLAAARRRDADTLDGTPAQGSSTAQTPVPPSQGQSPAATAGSQPGTQAATPLAQAAAAATPAPPLDALGQPATDLLHFIPWPAPEKIRVGGLAFTQQLAEQGIDPLGYDPAAEEARRRREAEERLEQEERERLEREERERRIWEERERQRAERERQRVLGEAAREGAATQGPQLSPVAGSGDKKQFQFASMLDDDEE